MKVNIDFSNPVIWFALSAFFFFASWCIEEYRKPKKMKL